jgi:hypothetical protein
MWPFKNKSKAPRQTQEVPSKWMRCGTPFVQMHSDNPSFFIRCSYGQSDGSTIIEDEYPYDGRRETRVVPKGGRID